MKEEINYNFHTHTKLCGHAGVFSMEEYVINARNAHIFTLGFSDHSPVSELEYQNVKQRMHLLDVEEYLNEIKRLKQKYTDMEIYSSFEAEYKKESITFLNELRSKVDYLVLGQHFVNNVEANNNKDYPILYAKSVVEALDTGLFDLIVHPDIFMSVRKTIISEEDKNIFDKNSIIASKMICDKANLLSIPLEINLLGARENRDYPSNLFFEIAKENNNLIIFGVDAHNPNQFLTIKDDIKKAYDKIKVSDLNIIDDFNPVTKRNKNLDILLKKTMASSYTYLTYLSYNTMFEILSNLEDNLDKESIYFEINNMLSTKQNLLAIESSVNDKKLVNDMEKIAMNNFMSYEEKSYRLYRIKLAIERANITLTNLQNNIKMLIDSVKSAFDMGVANKNELLNIITKLTEIKTTRDSSIKRVLIEEVSRDYENLGGRDNVSKLVKSNNQFKDNEKQAFFGWASGFVNVLAITLILTFISGVGVGIALNILG